MAEKQGYRAVPRGWEQLNNPDFNSLEFEGIRNEAGRNNFSLSANWSASNLQLLLGYGPWRRFEDAVKCAMTSCETSGNSGEHRFAGVGKVITGGKGAVQVVAFVKRLADDLTAQFGRGFGVVNLSQTRKFNTLWPMPSIFQTPSEKLAVPASSDRKLQTLSEKSSAASQNFLTMSKQMLLARG